MEEKKKKKEKEEEMKTSVTSFLWPSAQKEQERMTSIEAMPTYNNMACEFLKFKEIFDS